MTSVVLVFSFLFAVLTAEQKLPSYIKPCSRSDPEFENCIIKQSNEVLPLLLKGDKDYHIPPLNPLKINEEYVHSSPNLQIKLSNIVINGFDTATLTAFTMDLENHYVTANLYMDKYISTGTYEIDGHIQVMPIKGNGPYSLNLSGVNIDCSFKNTISKKNGVDFMDVNNINMKVTSKNAVVNFDNLFNGDKKLGDETNKYLNDNWDDVKDDIIPTVEGVLKAALMEVLDAFMDKVPYDEILLP